MTTRLRDGARRAVPIGIAVLLFGVSFGLLARTAGMGRVAPIVMSATTFAGSAQFAAASILHAGGTVAAAILAAVLLNVRYAPISISVAGLFGGTAPKRLAQSQLIVDESWALAARAEVASTATPCSGRGCSSTPVGSAERRLASSEGASSAIGPASGPR